MRIFTVNSNAFRRGVSTLAFLAAISAVAAETVLASGHSSHAEPAEVEINEADAKNSGIELGEYRIRSYYPVQARKSIVRFVLYATAQEGHFAEAKRLVASRRHKVRDQVITATRLVPLAEFDESDLSNFRRRILLRLRRTFPELTVKDVYVSEFELKVQSL
jgi:hypothetical protein